MVEKNLNQNKNSNVSKKTNTSSKAKGTNGTQTSSSASKAISKSQAGNVTKTSKPASSTSKPATALKQTAGVNASQKPKSSAKTVASGAGVASGQKISQTSTKASDKQKKSRLSKKSGDPNDKGPDKVNPKVLITSLLVSLVVVGVLIFGVILIRNNKGAQPVKPYYNISYGIETMYDGSQIKQYEFNKDYSGTTIVGFSGEVIGTVTRNIPPETRDEGLSTGYPKYGYTLSGVIGSGKESLRDALIAESNYLCANGTSNASGNGGGYNRMDENGYLYNGTEPALDKNGMHRRLYKHTGAVGLYLGDVSDDEEAIIKRVTMRPRGYNGYGVTGVYAPAGEIIKIQISQEDMNATGGLTIHIGQALYNGQANNIWTAKNQMQRMPVILNTMVVNKTTATLDEESGVYTAYVGSFLGGPLYIRNTNATFTATISGGVRYSHFILGYTTEQEFEENKASSAPYFDMEVWNYGVLHSGPKTYANAFSYQDLYKSAVLWEKVSSVTTTGSSQGIVFLYDPFVAAGAAVAFPGRRSVNCPMGWMSNSLNYNSIVNSGAWGNFHEYHHNFQGYGVGNGGEVTNNGMTLVSYSLFTKISSARGIGSFGASGMSGWNCYTSATWALEQTLKIARENESPSNGNQGLALYATLLHNFGPDNYIQAKVRQQRMSYGQYYLGYLKAWQDITHNDMSYYFNDILKAGLSDEVLGEYKNDSYPMFVPVSSVFQTGRSYMYDGEKKYIETMQPYVIPYGTRFTVDLNKYTAENGMYQSGSIVVPDGFSYTIKGISGDFNGTFVETETPGIYTYTPDSKIARSGKIIVTLGLTKNDGEFTVQDVDLVLEFEQSHETNKTMLERTTYTYREGEAYTSAVEAFENNYVGFVDKVEGDNINKIQNSNADIWYTNKDGDDVPQNAVVELKGKIYVDETAKYRIALRGRWNVALFVSFDGGVTYEKACSYISTNGSADFIDIEGAYKDYELNAGTWVHFKAVMVTDQQGVRASFVGLGWGKFVPEAAIFDEEGNITGYIPESVKVSYASAYRSDYEFSNAQFETDYFYTRKYNYNYVGEANVVTNGKTQTLVADKSNYIPWDANLHNIQNLFDGNSNTGIHFSSAWGVSTSKPGILTFDVGEEITANSLTLYAYNQAPGNFKGFPKNFTLEGSLNGTDFFDMGSWTNAGAPKISSTFTFNNQATFSFRYYRLTVTATDNGRVALNGITFENTLRLNGDGNNFISPDNDALKFSGEWKGVATQSSFGHIYVGKKNATISFEFTGTRLAILSSKLYGNNIEVTIDGQKVNSIDVKEVTDSFGISYLSEKLSSGNHKVVIKCLGEANIDSIAFYNET